MLSKIYTTNAEGYTQLSEENPYLLDVTRTVVLQYVLLQEGEKATKSKYKELEGIVKYCGIKLKSKKSKDQEFYTKLFADLVKEINNIQYDVELGVMNEVVELANICTLTRNKVIEYRANKKSFFKLILG